MSQALTLERGLNLGKSGPLALEPESRPAVNAEQNKSGRGFIEAHLDGLTDGCYTQYQ